MKKIILTLFCGLLVTASFAQQPTSAAYGYSQSATPVYASGGNTGNNLTWAYLNLQTGVGKDTINLVTYATHTKIVIDSLTANLLIRSDSTGDTAFYSNYSTGHSGKWYKKNPFLFTHEGDELIFIIHGKVSSSYTITWGSYFQPYQYLDAHYPLAAADTTHFAALITKQATLINTYVMPASTSASRKGVTFTWVFNAQLNRWILKSLTPW